MHIAVAERGKKSREALARRRCGRVVGRVGAVSARACWTNRGPPESPRHASSRSPMAQIDEGWTWNMFWYNWAAHWALVRSLRSTERSTLLTEPSWEVRPQPATVTFVPAPLELPSSSEGMVMESAQRTGCGTQEAHASEM